MASFFSKLNKTIFNSGETVPKPPEEGEHYVVLFKESRLGIAIEEGKLNSTSKPRVKSVEPSSEAMYAGVMPGDIITELEGNDIADFESFQPFLTAIGRPVRITFFRRAVAAKPASTLSSLLPTSSSSSSSSSASSSSQPSSSSSSSVVSDLYKSFSSSFSGMSSSGDASNNNSNTNNNTTSNATSNLSEEEKQARRDMLSKAANDRNWEKQAQAKRAARKQQSTPAVPISEETARSIQKSKQVEAAIERDMGFSPFRPVMSFAGNSVASTLTSAPAPSVELIAAVDDALAKILSLGEPDREIARTALQTVQKMLNNLNGSRDNAKFRSIRMSNDAFQKKVAVVPGAVELLVAGGYVNNSDNKEDAYLVHGADEQGLGALQYTVTRITEVLDTEYSNSAKKASSQKS
eukprot:gene33113-42830_t